MEPNGGRMLNRRFVMVGAGASGALVLASNARANPFVIEGIAIAIGLLVAAAQEIANQSFQKDAVGSLRTLKNDAANAARKLQEAIDKIPYMIDENDAEAVGHAINGGFNLVFDLIAARMQRGDDLSKDEDLRDRALEIADRRYTLAEYGPQHYAKYAKAFMSEAVAWRALGNEQDLFSQLQRHASSYLNDVSRQFSGLAAEAERSAAEERAVWNRYGKRYYIGEEPSATFYDKKRWLEYIGSFETGVSKWWIVDNNNTVRDKNSKEVTAAEARNIVKKLNAARKSAKDALEQAEIFKGHSDGARQYAMEVSSMPYNGAVTNRDDDRR